MQNQDQETLTQQAAALHEALLESKAAMDALIEVGEERLNQQIQTTIRHSERATEELIQAQRVVDLAHDRIREAEESRKQGERKAAKAALDEHDAQIAFQTAEHMVLDSEKIRQGTEKDTAQLLLRAEVVLRDTLKKAQNFLEEKKLQREEADAATVRLYATETAIQYAAAKAERNESEREQEKIIADYQVEVHVAEYEAIKLQYLLRELADHRQQAVQALEQVEQALAAAEAVVAENLADETAARETAKEEIAACLQERDEAVDALAELQQQQTVVKNQKQQELQTAEADFEQKTADSAASEMNMLRIAEQTAKTKEEELHKRDLEIERIDGEIKAEQESCAVLKEDYLTAQNLRDDAQAKAQELRLSANDYAAHSKLAAEEEEAAKEAMETSSRLAEDAIRVREMISEETALLLLQAQEVLLETAGSAKQLSEKKSELRRQADQEYLAAAGAAEAAEKAAAEAARKADETREAWNRGEDHLQRSENDAERSKQALIEHAETIIEQAEALLKEAEAEAVNNQQIVAAAEQVLEGLNQELAGINAILEQMAEQRGELLDAAETTIAGIEQNLSDYVRDKQAARALAEEEVARLENEQREKQGALDEVLGLISKTEQEEASACEEVEKVIATGSQAIAVAEDTLAVRLQMEEVAQEAAEDAMACTEGMRQFQLQWLNPQAENLHLPPLPELSAQVAAAAAQGLGADILAYLNANDEEDEQPAPPATATAEPEEAFFAEIDATVADPAVEVIDELQEATELEPPTEPLVEPLVEPLAEPLAEAPAEPEPEAFAEPLAETSPLDPFAEQLAAADQSPAEAVLEPEPLPELSAEPFLEPPTEPPTEPLTEPLADAAAVEDNAAALAETAAVAADDLVEEGSLEEPLTESLTEPQFDEAAVAEGAESAWPQEGAEDFAADPAEALTANLTEDQPEPELAAISAADESPAAAAEPADEPQEAVADDLPLQEEAQASTPAEEAPAAAETEAAATLDEAAEPFAETPSAVDETAAAEPAAMIVPEEESEPEDHLSAMRDADLIADIMGALHQGNVVEEEPQLDHTMIGKPVLPIDPFLEDMIAEEEEQPESGEADEEARRAAENIEAAQEVEFASTNKFSAEDLEYTTWLDKISQDALDTALRSEQATPEQQQAEQDYEDWIANLERSVQDDAAEAAAEPVAEAANDPLDEAAQQAMENIRTAAREAGIALKTNRAEELRLEEEEFTEMEEETEEEDSLRRSILSVFEPKKKSGRRFPFF